MVVPPVCISNSLCATIPPGACISLPSTSCPCPDPIPLPLPPVTCRLTLAASPAADFGLEAAAAWVAANSAPLFPRSPVPWLTPVVFSFEPIPGPAAGVTFGIVCVDCLCGGCDGDGPRVATLLFPATGAVVFFWLLKARVAPWRAAEMVGLAFPVAEAVDKAEVDDRVGGVGPRPWLWVFRVGDGGGCIGR